MKDFFFNPTKISAGGLPLQTTVLGIKGLLFSFQHYFVAPVC